MHAADQGYRWWVVVWDDRVNTFVPVVHVLRQVCELELADAVKIMLSVHRHDSARVMCYADREHAEATVAKLQVLGLHAAVEVDRDAT